MPPWLQRLLGSDRAGLSESIAAVLGRNQPAEIHPDKLGGRNYPVPLETVIVEGLEPHERPFVTDTLSELVGGYVPTKRGFSGFVPYLGHLGRAGGMANPITRSVRYDDEDSLYHEYGHIADYRDMYPDLERDIQRRFSKATDYAGINETEHFASAFDSAVRFLRFWSHFPEEDLRRDDLIDQFAREIEEYDEGMPGTREAIMVLSKHPIYANKFSHMLRSVQPKTYSGILNFDLGPR